MRASKVSSMHKINILLLESIESRVIVSDLHGLIYGNTKNVNALFDLEKSQKSINGKNLINFISDALWQEIITEIIQKKAFTTRKELKWEVENTSVVSDSSFYPIFDFDNNLTFVICFIEKESIKTLISAKTQQIVQVKRHLFKKFGNFFKK
jgi:sensor histidine kinase regulating citrate/malate metabolism